MVDLRYGAFGWLGDGLLGPRAGEEPECHKQDADGGDPAATRQAPNSLVEPLTAEAIPAFCLGTAPMMASVAGAW